MAFTPQKILPFTTIALILAAFYVAWTFYSRNQTARRAQQELAAKQEDARKRVVDHYFGNGEIKFNSFAVSPAVLQRGQTAQLCYGVANAKSLKITPPVEPIKPSYFHCLTVAPKKTTTYTLTADDGAGHTKSESLEIHVE